MYFPKSQIQTNLYTNGNEFQKITTKETYTGFYFKTSTGQFYTGKTPNDGPNTQLVKFNSSTPDILTSTSPILPSNITTVVPEFLKLISAVNDTPTDSKGNAYPSEIDQRNYPRSINQRYLPVSTPTFPTEKEYEVGVFQRYFCKKNNELVYIEINKRDYDLLVNRSPNIAWDLYSALPVLWYIKGNIEDVYKINKNLISLIERKNKWHGFTQYFKDDFTKYTLEA
jgi:hypothetical protein